MVSDSTNVKTGYYMLAAKQAGGHRRQIGLTCRICLVLEGEALWEISKQRYKVKKGDIIFFSSKTERKMEKILSAAPFKLFLVDIEPQFLVSLKMAPLFFDGTEKQVNPIITPPFAEEIFRLLKNVKKESLEGEDGAGAVIEACTTIILFKIMRYYKSCGHAFSDYRLSEPMKWVLDYIDEHYTEAICLKDAAHQIYMSESAFSRHFTKCIGVGFSQYVNQKRIGKAIRLLESGDDTVISIAMQCGFGNGTSFYAAFKKFTGMKPTEYKRQYCNANRQYLSG